MTDKASVCFTCKKSHKNELKEDEAMSSTLFSLSILRIPLLNLMTLPLKAEGFFMPKLSKKVV